MKKNTLETNIIHELFLIFIIFALGFITCKLFFNQTVLLTKLDFSDKVLVEEKILDFGFNKPFEKLKFVDSEGDLLSEQASDYPVPVSLPPIPKYTGAGK